MVSTCAPFFLALHPCAPRSSQMALMAHELTVELPSGDTQVWTSTLLEFGRLGPDRQTAMARTVGFTAGIAAQLILDGEAPAAGVQEPTDRGWYLPILRALEEEVRKPRKPKPRHTNHSNTTPSTARKLTHTHTLARKQGIMMDEKKL